jgi:hypothetical protein
MIFSIAKLTILKFFFDMRIGLIISDFESSYATSFQHTARVKYEVDFDTSNVDSLGDKLKELRYKVENKLHRDVHVGFEITIDHVEHVQDLLQKILKRYIEVFGRLPVNKKIYTINQKLREAETPSNSEIAKQVLVEILNPKTQNLSKAEKLKLDAEAKSKERALKTVKKNSRK